MLDKLAEIVREGRRNIPDNFCVFCPPDKRCKLSECPNSDDENSLMLARWAVLLVAKGLEREVKHVEEAHIKYIGCIEAADIEAYEEIAGELKRKLGQALMNLIAEAKEDTNG